MLKKYQRWIGLFIAIQLSAIAIVLFVEVNLGSDTITVFEDGLSQSIGCTLGQASILYNLIVLPIALLMNYKNIGWSTFLYSLCVGYFIDFYQNIFLIMNFQMYSFIIRLMIVIIAQCCFVTAYALLIALKNGMSITDAFVSGIAQKTHIEYKYLRTLIDAVTLCIGFLLGGTVGIGSIITMLTTGTFVHIIVRKFYQAYSFHEMNCGRE